MALQIVAISQEEMDALTSRTPAGKDLTEYVALVAPLPVGEWFKFTVPKADNAGLERRTLNKAAREIGKDLTFRKAKVDPETGDSTIYFKVGEIDNEKIAKLQARAEKARNSRQANKKVRVAV